ncbi:MAG: ABC transporter ATP-binding protein [Sediminimonas sp.]|uniref:ABC transporter ATP-binding protein n=1 Tax=Sediminimonas sp. TaxID=2823379 RepID=UPI0028707254|nr:ABC transporter ATP-binding protein [Sediminimonas sp.]MDR9484196.1 ABC transporter ATP-binding protein [Sediminimonas sp.]
MMTRLIVENLTCRHGLLTAVRDVSFALRAGEVLCVIGANGAGKTTLMNAIAGTHRPVGGRIALDGVDVTAQPAFARVRSGIAMSPEGRRLFADMTVRENLLIAAENGRAGDWTLARVLEAFPQLRPLTDMPAGRLSGGQRQAAAIGRALLTNPVVLLLDEVSLGLSPAAVEGVYQSLAMIKEARTTTMVVVEQDLTRALGFADQVLCMAEGQTELQGMPGHLSREQITDAYFGIHDKELSDV